ncbi:SH3 domain-containing protein [Saccharothrix coeruleofusca]|uniref:SH3 domain-containing protein n=1 Tax=Saccharothrix coeruleofusca TaxID=33919 RepID=A0A918AUC9_9PSEU|nr:SH3 domain-containing protein [Saccharothrix coeruleofusca]MBP2337033.1 hypothetical protein [Saccharothrix coeruleofusca]GGP86615.1 hypothetical protein GCM10010185_70460 [Saccharothrix coeruleofusca]
MRKNAVAGLSGVALSVLLAASVPSVALAGPTSGQEADASAACRSHNHSAKDSFNDGYPSKSSVPVRSEGPYKDCSIDGYIDSSTRLHYHCYTVNDAGNTWTWVRVVGQDIAGWVWDENLEGYGSAVRC